MHVNQPEPEVAENLDSVIVQESNNLLSPQWQSLFEVIMTGLRAERILGVHHCSAFLVNGDELLPSQEPISHVVKLILDLRIIRWSLDLRNRIKVWIQSREVAQKQFCIPMACKVRVHL